MSTPDGNVGYVPPKSGEVPVEHVNPEQSAVEIAGTRRGHPDGWIEGAVQEIKVRRPAGQVQVHLMVHGQPYVSEEALPNSQLVKTEFYNDFLKPQGVFHSMGGTIVQEAGLDPTLR